MKFMYAAPVIAPAWLPFDGDAQHVGPVVEGVLHVALAREQLVDRAGALVGLLGVKEPLGLTCRRDAADDVQIDAADKSVVVGGRIAFQLVLLPVGCKNRVDLLGRSRHISC